jgi:DNA-binding transcriptional ArsR family regulator
MAVTRKSHQSVRRFNLTSSRRTLPMLQPSEGLDCVVALKALGEETRLRIVALVFEQPMEVGEIARRLGVSQYNVSKHLRILREAGLLEVEKDGRRHLYALPDAIKANDTGLVDLGCCSFRFDLEEARSQPSGPERPRKRAERPHARVTR